MQTKNSEERGGTIRLHLSLSIYHAWAHPSALNTINASCMINNDVTVHLQQQTMKQPLPPS